MMLYNPFTRECIEYTVDFDVTVLNYHIRHETPFTDRYSEWAVSMLENGDMVYLPYGNNRCADIYVVTYEFTSKLVPFPHGIYTAPMGYFCTAN